MARDYVAELNDAAKANAGHGRTEQIVDELLLHALKSVPETPWRPGMDRDHDRSAWPPGLMAVVLQHEKEISGSISQAVPGLGLDSELIYLRLLEVAKESVNSPEAQHAQRLRVDWLLKSFYIAPKDPHRVPEISEIVGVPEASKLSSGGDPFHRHIAEQERSLHALRAQEARPPLLDEERKPLQQLFEQAWAPDPRWPELPKEAPATKITRIPDFLGTPDQRGTPQAPGVQSQSAQALQTGHQPSSPRECTAPQASVPRHITGGQGKKAEAVIDRRVVGLGATVRRFIGYVREAVLRTNRAGVGPGASDRDRHDRKIPKYPR